MAENPMAGVSGPGPYAKRTDVGTPEMKMGSIGYGEGVETQAIKSGAPLGKTPDAVAEPQDRLRPAPASAPVTELFAPTARPSEPITSGVDIGDGPGSEAMRRLPNPSYTIQDVIKNLIPYDPSGDAELIYRSLLDEGY